MTTAGINITLALADRQAVVDAYPNAILTFSGTYDPISSLSSVRDPEMGIEVTWSYDV